MEYWIVLFKVIFIFAAVAQPLASICVWVERKGSALIQDRIGANRAGMYFGFDTIIPMHLIENELILKILKSIVIPLFNILFLPIFKFLGLLGVVNTLVCDAVKALFKEDFVPEGTSNFVHSLAPFMAAFPIFLAFALVPVAPDFALGGYQIRPQVASLNVGILFVLAMGSIAVYGAALAGWCGNNKFSLMGGLRTSAQMISYELTLGIAVVAMILMYGTADLYDMVTWQSTHLWGIIFQPLTFLLFFTAGMAETKRAPFDLPEAESELVAGYFTEYSGMKFLLFWLGEFAEIGLLSALITLLFFGGWHLPGVLPVLDWASLSLSHSTNWSWLGEALAHNGWARALVGHGVFMLKVTMLCVLQIVIRWTLPRFRYDQLMNLGWKFLLPLSLVNLMVAAAFKLGF